MPIDQRYIEGILHREAEALRAYAQQLINDLDKVLEDREQMSHREDLVNTAEEIMTSVARMELLLEQLHDLTQEPNP